MDFRYIAVLGRRRAPQWQWVEFDEEFTEYLTSLQQRQLTETELIQMRIKK